MVGTPPHVATTDNNAHLNARIDNTFYLGRDVLERIGIDSEVVVTFE
jgi:hypothetical protein